MGLQNALYKRNLAFASDADERTLLSDLITDILHLLHSKQIDPNQVLETAVGHFETEISG